MRILGLQIHRYHLPLRTPINLGGRELRGREGLLLCLHDDRGGMGWGDVAPLPGFSPETLADARRELRDILAAVKGESSEKVDSAAAHSCSSVRFGLEQALRDLERQAGLRAVPGGTVPVNALLADRPDQVPRAAEAMVANGYTCLKLKVGRAGIAEEVESVTRLRERVGEGIGLRLDANRAWTLDEALVFARGVRPCAIEYIEEPLQNPREMSRFIAEGGLPVALDETLLDVPLDAWRNWGPVRALVIKPGLVGGLSGATHWIEQARGLGATPVLSSLFESDVGILGLAELALAEGLGDTAHGLDTLRFTGQHVLRPPLEITDGGIDCGLYTGRPLSIETQELEDVG